MRISLTISILALKKFFIIANTFIICIFNLVYMTKKSRHQTRFVLIQAIYQHIITQTGIDLYEFLRESKVEKVDVDFINELHSGVLEKMDEMMIVLKKVIKKHKFDNLDITVKAILLCGFYEIMYKKLSKAIVINEYVSLTKRFHESGEYKFVHAVLDSLKLPEENVEEGADDSVGADTKNNEVEKEVESSIPLEDSSLVNLILDFLKKICFNRLMNNLSKQDSCDYLNLNLLGSQLFKLKKAHN